MARFTNKILGMLAVLMIALLPGFAAMAEEPAMAPDTRAATGGATTLEDILRRQEGLKVDNSYRSDAIGDPAGAFPSTDQLGTLGGVSDAEFWRAFRYGRQGDLGDVRVSSAAPAASVVIQDSGMAWLNFRKGPLATYGGYLLLGMLGVLVLFYLFRGKIRIDGEKAGTTIERFKPIERFAHWLLGGSFILLGITGLTLLFGRVAIIPLIGHEAYSPFAIAGKWVHNNFSWAFMLGLVMVTVFWVAHNIPNKHDLKWISVAGGLFTKGVHPPAKKFNAGQKLIFWSVIVLGYSISASGLSLLFPFELPMFAATFAKLNALGIPEMLGFAALPTELLPHQEMQLAQLWHGIIAFVFMAIIIGHIYIGSVGMEGAFDAMGSGQVDEQWAREHHGLWYEEVTGKKAHDHHPAE